MVRVQSILSVMFPDLPLRSLKASEAPETRGFVLGLAVPREKDLKPQIDVVYQTKSREVLKAENS